MKCVLAFLGGLVVLSALSAASQAASNCPAGGFVLNAGQAFAAASRQGSASAFIGAASRYADTRSIALSALGIHRKKLSRADEGEYVRLAQSFMGRFLARYGNNFNVTTKDSARLYTFHFKTGDGLLVEKSYVTTAYDLGEVGSQVKVIYNRNNPQEFIVDGFLPVFY